MCQIRSLPIRTHPLRLPFQQRPPDRTDRQPELTSSNVTNNSGGAASTHPKVHKNAPQLQETILTGLIPTAQPPMLDCQMKSSSSLSDWQRWMRTASNPLSVNRGRSLHTDLWRVNGATSRLRTSGPSRESADSGEKSSRSSCTNM